MCDSKMAAQNVIGYCVVQKMVENLGYQEVCAHQIPHLLTDEHKLQPKNFPLIAARIRHQSDNFLQSIMMRKGWLNNFDFKTIRQTMEWYHTTFPNKISSKQFPQPVKPWALSFGMLKDAYWSSLCLSAKSAMLLITFI